MIDLLLFDGNDERRGGAIMRDVVALPDQIKDARNGARPNQLIPLFFFHLSVFKQHAHGTASKPQRWALKNESDTIRLILIASILARLDGRINALVNNKILASRRQYIPEYAVAESVRVCGRHQERGAV